MKIVQLFEKEIEEARRGNWGREQSHATGQQLGKDIASGLPSADQQAAIKTGQAQAAQGQQQADLRARLAQHKAQKAAAPAQAEPSAQQATTTQSAGQAPAAKPSLTQRVTGAIQKASDVAGAVAGGISNIGGSLVGGARRGYDVQTGKFVPQYGGPPPSASRSSPAVATSQYSGPGAAGSSDQDVAELSARVDALEKALRSRAVAEDFKFPSNFLGRDI